VSLDFEPAYISFDCYGTLIHFQLSAETRDLLADRLPAERVEEFLDDYEAYRGDEVLGPWQPYPDVITNAYRRALDRHGVPYRDGDGERLVAAVPMWGPHPDTREGLLRLAERYPLVILSNAQDDQIAQNVDNMDVPFHAVLTSTQAQIYKPRLGAFEFMFEKLGCDPSQILHVSSSLRYDLIAASELHIGGRVYVNRGYEPSVPEYGYHEVTTIGGLADLVLGEGGGSA
jgi:2-haloacid dehalogenase